jgi:hypothetical protein
VELAARSSGTVASVSGLTVSTGVPFAFAVVEVPSPAEDATFFPHPLNGTMMMQQSRATEVTRRMSQSGIAHLSL